MSADVASGIDSTGGDAVDVGELSPCVRALCKIVEGLGELQRLDPQTMTSTDLDTVMTWSLRLGHGCDAVARRFALEWETHGLGTRGRWRNAASRLARLGHTTRREAGRVLTQARRLQSMPATAQALADGDVSIDHVDRLATGTTRQRGPAFERDEAALVGLAQDLSFERFGAAMAYWRNHVDAEAGDDGGEPDAERHLEHRPGVFGETHLVADLDPVGGAQVVRALEMIADQLADRDRATCGRVTRSRRQLRADALVEMARRAMAAPADGVKPRPLVTVVVGQHEFARLCELSNGTVVGPGDLVAHLDTIDIATMIFDGNFTAIDKSSQRTFTGALRRAIEVRDRRCTHPDGCDAPLDRCDVDHLVPYHRGGATSQANGRLLCRYHNRVQPTYCTPPPIDAHQHPTGTERWAPDDYANPPPTD